jgi:hypothetical protein
MGTAGVLRAKVGVIWEKDAARAVKINWERVIRRPVDSISLVGWKGCLGVIVYRYRAQSWRKEVNMMVLRGRSIQLCSRHELT